MSAIQPVGSRPALARLRAPRRMPWDGLVVGGILVALFVADVILQPALLDLVQVGLLVQTALPLVFAAAAQTLVIMVRGIDLSVGGMMVVTNALTVVWVGGHAGAHELLMLVVLLAGGAMGAVNGVLVAGLRLEPFIATLGTWTIFDGIALTVLPTDGGMPPPGLTSFALGQTGGIPNSLLIVLGLLVVWRALRGTALGTRIIAVGADEERGRLNGTPVRRVKLAVYVLAGICAGIGGILLAGTTSTGTPTAGDAYILTSVSAVVIGGTSLLGGSGGIGLSVMAALALTLISSIVSAINLSIWVSVAASAALLLVMVTIRALVEMRSRRAAL